MKDEEYQFVQKTNVVTGKLEWIAEHKDEHDYFSDIARSSYADMLHDTERNKLYHEAIKLAVNAVHLRGEKCRVLDIGTGTGLLSMMAAKAGAEEITAIEVFSPVADVARKIVKANHFNNIKVINKHSTEVTMGPNGDMKERANILVTELFDTELIGEGALPAYQHAHKHLVTEDCIAVPHLAKTFIQVVESPLMQSWHKMSAIRINRSGKDPIESIPNPELCEGHGVPAVQDIQLSEFPLQEIKFLSNPVEVFRFHWGSKTLTDKEESKVVTLEAKTSGTAQAILSWWDLHMDPEGEIILSTAPHWLHPAGRNQAWRDHWIQSVYFPPNEIKFEKGNTFCVKASHDAYSLWFDTQQSTHSGVTDGARPSCEYPPRMLWSRPRCAMINEPGRNRVFVESLEQIKAEERTKGLALCVSDFSLLPLLMAKCGFDVIALEESKIGQRGLVKLARQNDVKNLEVCVSENAEIPQEIADRRVSLLAAEPFFRASYLPWHDLHFWYVRTQLASYLHPDCRILPQKAHLCLAAVQFKDLWKIRAPVNTVEGFDVSLMDELIDSALETKEYYEPEPHALWEYPNMLLTKPTEVMTFDFGKLVPQSNVVVCGEVPVEEIEEEGKLSHCHAVVLWMKYDLDDTNSVSTGLDCDLKVDPFKPDWYMHQKQGVFFLKKPADLKLIRSKKSIKTIALNYEVTFLPETGELKMNFVVA